MLLSSSSSSAEPAPGAALETRWRVPQRPRWWEQEDLLRLDLGLDLGQDLGLKLGLKLGLQLERLLERLLEERVRLLG